MTIKKAESTIPPTGETPPSSGEGSGQTTLGPNGSNGGQNQSMTTVQKQDNTTGQSNVKTGINGVFDSQAGALGMIGSVLLGLGVLLFNRKKNHREDTN